MGHSVVAYSGRGDKWGFERCMALSAGQRTCDSQVAGSSSGLAPLRSGLEQATYAGVPLSPSNIIWYQPRGTSLAGKVTAGLVRLTAKKPGSALSPTFVVEYRTTFCCLCLSVSAVACHAVASCFYLPPLLR